MQFKFLSAFCTLLLVISIPVATYGKKSSSEFKSKSIVATKYDREIKALEKKAKRRPNNKEIQARYADLRVKVGEESLQATIRERKRGDWYSARDNIQYAIKHNPSNKTYKNELSKIEKKLAKLEHIHAKARIAYTNEQWDKAMELYGSLVPYSLSFPGISETLFVVQNESAALHTNFASDALKVSNLQQAAEELRALCRALQCSYASQNRLRKTAHALRNKQGPTTRYAKDGLEIAYKQLSEEGALFPPKMESLVSNLERKVKKEYIRSLLEVAEASSEKGDWLTAVSSLQIAVELSPPKSREPLEMQLALAEENLGDWYNQRAEIIRSEYPGTALIYNFLAKQYSERHSENGVEATDTEVLLLDEDIKKQATIWVSLNPTLDEADFPLVARSLTARMRSDIGQTLPSHARLVAHRAGPMPPDYDQLTISSTLIEFSTNQTDVSTLPDLDGKPTNEGNNDEEASSKKPDAAKIVSQNGAIQIRVTIVDRSSGAMLIDDIASGLHAAVGTIEGDDAVPPLETVHSVLIEEGSRNTITIVGHAFPLIAERNLHEARAAKANDQIEKAINEFIVAGLRYAALIDWAPLEMLADEESALDGNNNNIDKQNQIEGENTITEDEEVQEPATESTSIADTLMLIQAELEEMLAEKNLPIVWQLKNENDMDDELNNDDEIEDDEIENDSKAKTNESAAPR